MDYQAYVVAGKFPCYVIEKVELFVVETLYYRGTSSKTQSYYQDSKSGTLEFKSVTVVNTLNTLDTTILLYFGYVVYYLSQNTSSQEVVTTKELKDA